MSRLVRRAAGAAVTFCLAAAAAVLHTPPAGASTVPFSDSRANGYIGLCDSSGHQITSGSLSDQPFVVRAVSSTASPTGYTVGQGAKATLYAFQPIDGIDPGDWSGEQLTGSAFFSNPDHPMTDGTVLDRSMADFLSAFPVHWDNLVQLRIFYGQPGQSTYSDTYPAAVLRIDGSRWNVVQGGDVNCRSGKTKSMESLALPKSAFASASASIARSKSAAASRRADGGSSGESTGSTGSGGSYGRTTGSHSAGRDGGSTGAAESDATASVAAGVPEDAAQRTTTEASSWPLIAVLVIALLAVLGGAGSLWLRRRGSTD